METAAWYHCSVKPISRGEGASILGKAAYRAAELLCDERTGVEHDYRRRSGVVHTEIILPDDAPAALADRSTLWNAAEAAETRRNSRTGREIEIALPHQLDAAGRLELVRDYCTLVSARYGVAIDVAIHAPSREGDQRNHHAHILMTSRRIGPDGFGEKTRILDDRRQGPEEINALRALLAELTNRHLERAGVSERVDHRSFEDRGLDLEPTVHLGPFASFVEQIGKTSLLGALNRAIRTERDKQPIEELTASKAVFSRQDLASFLFRRGDDAERCDALLQAPEVTPLFDRVTGAATGLYTTKRVRAREAAVETLAGRRARDRQHRIAERHIRAGLAEADRATGQRLDAEQIAAVRHGLDAGGFALIQGRAGTGKSYTLNALRQVYEQAGYSVIGSAPTNTVVADLANAGFTSARTVHSLLWWLDRSQADGSPLPFRFDRRTVLMLDEAGMVDTETWRRLLTEADRAGVKVIAIGDDRQLGSIAAGGMFGTLADRHGAAELKTVRRQTGWQRQAAEALASGAFESALAQYQAQGCITWSREPDESMAALIEAWKRDTDQAGAGGHFAFAYTNEAVDRLNGAMQAIQIGRGQVTKLAEANTHKGPLLIGVGDRIQFRGTDKRLGVMNGALATIEQIERDGGHARALAVRLDSGARVSFELEQFNKIERGYAGTIYRGQGKTLDRSYLLHSHHWRDQSSYVALTRAREATQIFVSGQEDVQRLARQMARSASHGASLRYATEDERNRQKVERFTESDIIDDVRRGRGKDYSKLDNLLKNTNQDKEKDAPNTAKETEAKSRSAPPAIDREASIPLPDEEPIHRQQVDRGRYVSAVERFEDAMANSHHRHEHNPSGHGRNRLVTPDEANTAYVRLHDADQEKYNGDIANARSPEQREMLTLRRDVAQADHERFNPGASGPSAAQDRQAGSQRYAELRSTWQERSAKDQNLYVPLDDKMRAELARSRAAADERAPLADGDVPLPGGGAVSRDGTIYNPADRQDQHETRRSGIFRPGQNREDRPEPDRDERQRQDLDRDDDR